MCSRSAGFAAVDDTPDSDNAPAYPPAQELLDTVTASLPAVPVLVKAQIQSRNAGGEVERSFGADMRLDWHGRPPSAKYTIRDAFGDTLEGLNIVWPEAGPREFRYFKGDPPVAAKLENLYGAIQGTDIGWMDLSLSYLWWRGGKTVGAEKIKGRYCYIVDLRAPAGEAGEYAGVRLWIDPQIRILLQAAAYDAAGPACENARGEKLQENPRRVDHPEPRRSELSHPPQDDASREGGGGGGGGEEAVRSKQ